MTRWAILTGEYPPQFGGVADYTQLVASGLAATGDSVTVYAPPALGPTPSDPGVTVHRLPDHFGPRGLWTVDHAINCRPKPDRILVQYVPQAFGWKAMNLPFTAWVATRASRCAPLWVMFHEVMCPIRQGQSVRHATLGRVTRQMARQVARAADRVFVSIPAWGKLLRQIGCAARPAEWLPIPSNSPEVAEPSSIAAVRGGFPDEAVVIGHYGTFGGMNADFLPPVFARLLRQSTNRYGLFVGRGSVPFRDRFVAAEPNLATRLRATGELPAAEVAAHLAACDLLVQPYPDGASSRRTSLMAGLALGVTTVTNTGFLSEPMWGTESTGVAVARSTDPADLAPAAEVVLALPTGQRAALGRAAAGWYRSRFSVDQLIASLRAVPPHRTRGGQS